MNVPSVTVAEACELVTDGTHYTPKDVGEGVPFLTVKDVTDQRLDFDSCSFISEEDYETASGGNSAPKYGDVLFSKDGTVGKVHLVRCDRKFAVLSSLAILRPKADLIDAGYFAHALRSPSVLDSALKRKTGSAIRRIILSDLKQLSFPLPPLPEQRRIAAILDKADALRAKRKEALDQLDQLAQSIFIEMFGDPVINPNGWPKQPIDSLCLSPDDIKCGPFGTQLAKSEVTDQGVPLWGIKNVNALFRLPAFEFLSPATASRLSSYALIAGDIVMTRKGTIGNCAVYPISFPKGIMHSDLLRIRTDPNRCSSVFLSHQLQHSKDVERQLSLISGGAVMPGINVTKLKSLHVLYPSLQLQLDFVSRLSKISEVRAKIEGAREHLGTFFSSLQHRAFRGEL